MGWTVYSTNILNFVARITSFAWHASSRLVLTKTIPRQWHQGVLVCIFKGHNKYPYKSRGITLFSVIFNIFESVLEATAVYPNSH